MVKRMFCACTGGVGAEIEVAVAALLLLHVDEIGGADRDAEHVLERRADRGRLAERERRRLGLRDRGGVQVAADRDQAELAIHQHLDVVVEDLDALRLLAQDHDDPAAPRVVDLLHHRGVDRGLREPVARRVLREVIARRLLGAHSVRRGAGRARVARSPEERGDAAAIIHRRRMRRGQRPPSTPDQRRRRRRGVWGRLRPHRDGVVAVDVGEIVGVGHRADQERRGGEKVPKGALHGLPRARVARGGGDLAGARNDADSRSLTGVSHTGFHRVAIADR
jgi:hypothetical protein